MAPVNGKNEGVGHSFNHSGFFCFYDNIFFSNNKQITLSSLK